MKQHMNGNGGFDHGTSDQRRFRSVSTAIGALATAAAVHAQAILHVDDSAPSGGDGLTWTTAFRDLQDALDQARLASCVHIRVAGGVYLPDRGTGDRDLSFDVASCVYLQGGFAGLVAADPNVNDPARFVSVLSGDLARNDGPGFANTQDNTRTVVRTPTGGVPVIDGFTITGGNQDAGTSGAAIESGEHVTLRNCRLLANRSTWRSAPIIRAHRFAAVQSTIIAGNQVTDAEALIRAPRLAFQSCRLISNDAGAGFVVSAGAPGSTDSWFRAVNSAISSNEGAAVRIEGPVLAAIEHCTIVGNRAQDAAALLATDRARVRLWNSIVWDNVCVSPGGRAIVGENGAIVDFYTIRNFLGNGTRDVSNPGDPLLPFVDAFRSGDPRLADPDGPDNDRRTWMDNNYTPRADSPCIDVADTGSSTLFPRYDDALGTSAYNVPRMWNNIVGPIRFKDMGAFELSTPCPGDYLVDGVLSIEDLLAFISDWSVGSIYADVNDDGRVSVQDIFDMISRYTQECRR